MNKNTKQSLSKLDIILYSLYLFGGTTKKIHTEDIADKSFKLQPALFSWVKFPNYPDKDLIRRPLVGARLNGLVFGRSGKIKKNERKVSDGWMFTRMGVKWIEKNKNRFERLLGETGEISKQKPDLYRSDLYKKAFDLKETTAFRKFIKDKNCKNIKEFEFADFLDASLDTPSFILQERIKKLKSLAEKAKEKKIIHFIDKAEKHFATLLKV